MTNVLRIATGEAAPAARPPGGFAVTDTAKDILRSLTLIEAIDGAAITMIAGAPGVGKSRTLRHYAETARAAPLFHVVAMGEGTPWNLALGILGCAARGLSLAEMRDRVAWRIAEHGLLIVDEAQFLDQKDPKTGLRAAGLEWLRAAAETAGGHIVFAGDLALAAAVQRMPQLHSRMRRPVIVKAPARADVEAFAREEGVEDRDALAALAAVASRLGGLRNVENVLRLARLFAGGEATVARHVLAAVEDLKLAPKGGK